MVGRRTSPRPYKRYVVSGTVSTEPRDFFRSYRPSMWNLNLGPRGSVFGLERALVDPYTETRSGRGPVLDDWYPSSSGPSLTRGPDDRPREPTSGLSRLPLGPGTRTPDSTRRPISYNPATWGRLLDGSLHSSPSDIRAGTREGPVRRTRRPTPRIGWREDVCCDVRK